jgi:hypothetical protein
MHKDSLQPRISAEPLHFILQLIAQLREHLASVVERLCGMSKVVHRMGFERI